MADIRPFRAHRYNLAQVGDLSDVIAPPYDVIDPALQQALYDRSLYNTIRLILNRETPEDSDQNNRYTRSARCLNDWLADDILTQDSTRALYVYHQDYTVEGQSFTRKGVLARVRLEPFGQGRIYPHEQTLSGPKADRLKLFHATGMNLSPIFGLYPDPEQRVASVLEDAIVQSLPLQATDHLGVVSKLWTVTDSTALTAVSSFLANQPVFIADGHHRYETGLRYREERKAMGDNIDDEHPANFILMMLVGMSDPGLLILPTHRLFSGLAGLTGSRLKELLATCFEIETLGTGEAAAKETWSLIEADGGQNVLGFGTVADGGWHLARYRKPDEMARLAPDHSTAWQGLGVSILQIQVVEAILKPTYGTAPACRYVHLLSEVLEDVGANRCDLAVLVPPATMDHVTEIAGNLETMPPKSTYFYPKLLSGLVFNSLKTS
jgi:uncharacterized protein (DUF1015 family)